MSDIKIFVCPYNAYHKLYDNRKFTFHVARCKDRRGKSTFHCRYFHMHIFTSVEHLEQHELICERKPVKSETDHHMMHEPNGVRAPSQTFCKYNCEHVFKTLEDREYHETACPDKGHMEVKLNQAAQVYQRHKSTLKKSQADRHDQMQELYGSSNGPKSNCLPHLTYKYKMNEPFIGGDINQIQDSHEQAKFKLQEVYGISSPKREKNLDEQKMELVNQFQSNYIYVQPEVNFLIVKQDQEEMFGLEIKYRREDCSFFDFDIEEFICFVEFAELCKLRSDCAFAFSGDDWIKFIDEHCVMKMDMVNQEVNNTWFVLCQHQQDNFAKALFESNPAHRRTICLNSTRLNQNNTQVLLMLISKSTEFLGQFVENDYVILAVPVDVNNTAFELPKPLPVKPSAQYESEKADLELQLKQALLDVSELQKVQVTQEKVIRDAERQTRQDKKAIEFLEGDCKRARGEVQEVKEDLERKEAEVRNLIKDLERHNIDIKSLETRFAKIQKQSDDFQDKYTKEKISLERATKVLTEANKAIKHKEILLKQQELKIAELEKYVKQIKGLGQEQAPVESEQNPGIFDESLMTKLKQATQAAENVRVKSNPEDLQEEQKDSISTKNEFDESSILEGEIMGDDDDQQAQQQIQINKLQQKLQGPVKSSMSSRPNSLAGSKLKTVGFDSAVGVPEALLCVACLDRPKSTVIISCKHSVYCIKCDNEYNLKHHMKKECPICRKEYKKTMPIFFA